MSDALTRLHEADALDALDVAFGHWIAARSDAPTGLLAALVSTEVGKGHVCLDLGLLGELLEPHGLADPGGWDRRLADSAVVAKAGERAPLVRDGRRVYLHRYWCYETRLATRLRELAASRLAVDEARLKAALQALFPEPDGNRADRQALAAVLGATRRLTVISGGPGTGKTTTVLKLITLARRCEPTLRIALAAPTGKAAGRLAEVASGADDADGAAQLTPRTLHRLLGYNPARQTVRHDRTRPLPFDLIVVDEASMVDLGLMARLVDALAEDARLVLVGDRNQLASVEAGAVLGDICLAARGFPAAEADRLEALLAAPVPRADPANAESVVSASIALLKRNYRFGNQSIARFAAAVIAGDVSVALDSVTREDAIAGVSAASAPLIWREVSDQTQLDHALSGAVTRYFRPLLDAESPEAAMALCNRFRLLAAERHGLFGVEGLNERVEALLGLRSAGQWYRGRPLLITENDYELGLYNGDFGLVWPDEQGQLMAWIVASDGRLRPLHPARLAAHETCYAMTVHKAQGSEFEHVTLVLPPYASAVATRELLYTGVTRARSGVQVWAAESALRRAIEARIRRASGLAERL